MLPYITVPLVGVSIPRMTSARVDLPEPDSPIKPIDFPSGISNETPFNTSLSV